LARRKDFFPCPLLETRLVWLALRTGRESGFGVVRVVGVGVGVRVGVGVGVGVSERVGLVPGPPRGEDPREGEEEVAKSGGGGAGGEKKEEEGPERC